MKTILVPLNIDSSTISFFEYAQNIASEFQSSLVILYVVKKQSYDNGTFSPGTEVHQQMVHEARVILQQLARQAMIRGIRTKVVIADGKITETIIQTAKKESANVLLLSPSLPNDLETYQELMSEADFPILTWNGRNSLFRSSTPAPISLCPSTAFDHSANLAAA